MILFMLYATAIAALLAGVSAAGENLASHLGKPRRAI